MPAELHIDAHFTPRATLMYPAFAKFSLQLFLMICAKHIDNDMRTPCVIRGIAAVAAFEFQNCSASGWSIVYSDV